jgi:hypothetical protein
LRFVPGLHAVEAVQQFSAVRTLGHVRFEGDPLGQTDLSINEGGELRPGIETIHVLFASSPVMAALRFVDREGG